MPAPQGRVSRLQPRQLLVVAVLSVAMAGTACGAGSDVAATSAAQSGPVNEIPREASSPPVPPVAAPSEPSHEVGRSPWRGDEETTPDAGDADPAVTATLPAAAPVRLRIPAIGVDSEVMDLGLQPDGALEVPASGFPAGWYTGSPTPGELGPAIIAGHVDWGGRPAVFFALRELATDDEIAVTRQDGSTARFRVTEVERFAKAAFPTEAVYGDLDHAGLRLITCGGSFDRQMRSYEDNLVVFAELVGASRPSPVRRSSPGFRR